MKCQKDHNPGLEPNAKALSEEDLTQVLGGIGDLGKTITSLPICQGNAFNLTDFPVTRVNNDAANNYIKPTPENFK